MRDSAKRQVQIINDQQVFERDVFFSIQYGFPLKFMGIGFRRKKCFPLNLYS
jgi:hypothetical protein